MEPTNQNNANESQRIEHIAETPNQDNFLEKKKPRIEFLLAGICFFLASIVYLINELSINAPLWPALAQAGAFIFLTLCVLVWVILKGYIPIKASK